MTLSTKTPKDFFDKYQLVLQVPKAKMNKVRVFQTTRESAWPSFPSISAAVTPCSFPAPTRWGTALSRSLLASRPQELWYAWF